MSALASNLKEARARLQAMQARLQLPPGSGEQRRTKNLAWNIVLDGVIVQVMTGDPEKAEWGLYINFCLYHKVTGITGVVVYGRKGTPNSGLREEIQQRVGSPTKM